MTQLIVDTTRTTERFVEYTAVTRALLLADLNEHHEGMASIIAFGQAQDGTWYAVADRALKVILTLEDVMGMNQDRENGDGSDAVLRNTKLNMSA